MTETRPTLLVVDDVAANIDILLGTLSEDYTVRVATDGAAALSSVKKAPPDLILLDIMMPGMDGLEVCRRLKDDPTSRAIPIIFLTALTEDADEARGLKLGAVDYITKPFNPAIVSARVRNHLELKKHRDHLEEPPIWNVPRKPPSPAWLCWPNIGTPKQAGISSGRSTMSDPWLKPYLMNIRTNSHLQISICSINPPRCTTSARSPFMIPSC